MKVNNRKIYLLRNHLPHDIGETFLDIELKYATSNTEMFVINPIYSNIYHITNYKLYKIDFKLYKKKIDIIFIFFKRIFWEEVINVLRSYKKNEIINRIKELIYLFYLSNVAQKYIYKKIMKEKNKKIILYSYWFILSAYITSELKKKIRAKNIITISRAHRFDLYFNYPFKKYLAKNLDYICFISEHGRKYFQKTFKVKNKERLKLFYLGTQKTKFIEYKKNKKIKIISCSYIVKVKRLELLIDILLNTSEKIQIEWEHIGSGVDEDYEKKIKEYAREKLLNKKNIEYKFLGSIKNEKVIKYYRENYFDLFTNTSESEGLPVSMMEAMSFGVPVIGPNINGVPEIIESGKNGFLFDKDEKPEKIAKIIENYYELEDKEKEELRKNAYKTWEEKFNAEKNYKEFYGFLNRL